MDNKEAIIQAAISLVSEKGERAEEITVREISKRAGVGLGLVNYYFGNKEALIEFCIERIINGIVAAFRGISERTQGFTPFEKLGYLGNMTLTFLFEHYAVSKISILSEMRTPKENDNTSRTYRAYLPLVAACRPDWDESETARKTFCLIAAMQSAVIRYEFIERELGLDLKKAEERKVFHTRLLRDIVGEKI